ncbi:MAG: hypothetical protein J5828_05620 [Desulfovibrionaceae bacterium]|nr:hypothetical protein [Desulfovibrionaceae bacterium]
MKFFGMTVLSVGVAALLLAGCAKQAPVRPAAPAKAKINCECVESSFADNKANVTLQYTNTGGDTGQVYYLDVLMTVRNDLTGETCFTAQKKQSGMTLLVPAGQTVTERYQFSGEGIGCGANYTQRVSTNISYYED